MIVRAGARVSRHSRPVRRRRYANAAHAASRIALIAAAATVLCACGSGDRPSAEPQPIRSPQTIGRLGNSPGAFAYPRGIDHDSDALWVVDKSARVQRIDPKTGECLAWFVMPQSEMGKPVGVTVGPGPDGDEVLYIPDTHYSRVLVVRPPRTSPGGKPSPAEPELIASFGEYGTEDGQFIYPTDVAVLLSDDGTRVERIYVSEYGGNDRVSVFDSRYRFLFSFGRFGMGDDPGEIQFQRPQSIALDAAAGVLYVVDSRNHRIGRFSLDGELLGWIGSPREAGRNPGSFKYPYGISLLGDGTAMIVEYGNNRVQRVDLTTGESLGVWGQPGRGEGELAAPWAVTTMSGRTFILDSGNNRIVAFSTPRRRG